MSHYSILLVDDDSFIIKSIGTSLERDGYKVTSADSGEKAIQLLNESVFDLVITDLIMQEIDGFQVLKAAKNLKIKPMVIILTGHSDINLAIDSLRLGADDYALKPCEHEELTFRLNNCFEKLETKKKIRLSEEKLKESYLRYQTVADFTYDWETWIDPEGNYAYVSPSCERISGYNSEMFIKDPDLLIKITHPDDKQLVINHFKTGEALSSPMYPIDFRIIKKNGDTVWINHACKRVFDKEKNYLGRRGSNRDITDRKAYQKELEKSLNEKETLLQEIHHRVKNNMTVISSLLGLQITSVSDEKAKEALQDSRNRVHTMSTVHETLYRSDNLAFVNIQTYLSELGKTIIQSYSTDKVNMNIEAENILIGVKQASTLGLIVNELISNSLKYAFPDVGNDEINLSVKKLDKELELIVEDNGVGIPDGVDLKNSSTLGLKLVYTLVENQLDGSIGMESENGTKYIIKFNIET
jgi:PAS domain S-box-containing protein